MKRNFGIASALAASLLVLSPACKKDDKKKGEETGKVEDKAGGDTGNAGTQTGGAGSATAPSGDFLAHMPASTEIVGAISFKSLRSNSLLWPQVSAAAMAGADGKLQEFQKACGWNPLEKFESLYFGASTKDGEKPVIIVNGFARAEMKECVTKLSEQEGKKATLTEEGIFTTVDFEDESQEDLMIAWPNDKQMIVGGPEADKEWLQARVDGKDSIKGNAELSAAMGKTNQSALIWFAGAFQEGSSAPQDMGGMIGGAPKALFGSINASTGMDINLGMTFADNATAEKVLQQAKAIVPMFASKMPNIANKLEMTTADADMKVSLSLTDADMAELQSMAGAMGGM